MSRVSVLAAEGDSESAGRLVSGLRKASLEVSTEPGSIDQEECVVLVWSKRALDDPDLLHRAASAAQRGRLLPVLVEDLELPSDLRRIQGSSLIGWEPGQDDAAFPRLVASIARMLSGGADPDRPEVALRPDVFLSYSREDLRRAQIVACVLQALGWSVWWDREILTGREFDQAILEAIEASKCVVALWSARSLASRWVRWEAMQGQRREALVSVLLESVAVSSQVATDQPVLCLDWGPGVDWDLTDDRTSLARLAFRLEAVIDRGTGTVGGRLATLAKAAPAESLGDGTIELVRYSIVDVGRGRVLLGPRAEILLGERIDSIDAYAAAKIAAWARHSPPEELEAVEVSDLRVPCDVLHRLRREDRAELIFRSSQLRVLREIAEALRPPTRDR